MDGVTYHGSYFPTCPGWCGDYEQETGLPDPPQFDEADHANTEKENR